ncbi:hypothetical protein BDK51DRAFT_45193 [Blyttiomyces helicus]|uniref:Uncharacterized protein n=1 Tax=Blyttiomyces helicus TaxID=388810 RepID=A0A4P9WHL5_9FUNG|nr:hypothetical protein BDK51DRAFT_45193 [Blyttiomyces helicus]|eukprot:RKO91882.1 hypothetical protein BDK51DRAFT_45193 [Blyttiomyces helicus]
MPPSKASTPSVKDGVFPPPSAVVIRRPAPLATFDREGLVGPAPHQRAIVPEETQVNGVNKKWCMLLDEAEGGARRRASSSDIFDFANRCLPLLHLFPKFNFFSRHRKDLKVGSKKMTRVPLRSEAAAAVGIHKTFVNVNNQNLSHYPKPDSEHWNDSDSDFERVSGPLGSLGTTARRGRLFTTSPNPSLGWNDSPSPPIQKDLISAQLALPKTGY